MLITLAVEEPQSLVHRVQGCHFTAAYSLEEFLNHTGSTLDLTGTVPESKTDMGASLQVTTSILQQQAPF